MTLDDSESVPPTVQQSGPPWGLDRIDQRSLPLSGTYSYNGAGAGVTAYIVDSGIRADHVDFGGRVRSGFSTVNDGLGTDDWCNGHGTHVAGTVGGQTFGVAKSVSLVAVRVLDCTGSTSTSQLLQALDWVIADHPAGVPAVANLSIGGPASSIDRLCRAGCHQRRHHRRRRSGQRERRMRATCRRPARRNCRSPSQRRATTDTRAVFSSTNPPTSDRASTCSLPASRSTSAGIASTTRRWQRRAARPWRRRMWREPLPCCCRNGRRGHRRKLPAICSPTRR